MNFDLHDWQDEALDLWIKKGKKGIIEAVTGSGKTYLALAAARHMYGESKKLRTIVVVPPGRKNERLVLPSVDQLPALLLQEQTRYERVEWFGKGLRGWFPLDPPEESRVSKDQDCHWFYFSRPKVGSNPCLPVDDQSTLIYAQVQQEPAGGFVAGWITVLLFCGL